MSRATVRFIGLIAMVVALLWRSPARADDDIAPLTKMLASSSDRIRLSAVASLARMGGVRTLPPLLTALHDPNVIIRVIAATALGNLRDKAALPALRSAAVDDTDPAVRDKARAATLTI